MDLPKKPYFKRLLSVFGWRFLIFLITTQLLIKGLLYGLYINMTLPLFEYLNIDATNYQLLTTLAFVPWTVKPLLGVISDLFPIGGYHKKYWLLFSIFIGISAYLTLVIDYTISIPFLTVCFIAVNFDIVVSDLFSESKYSELMRKNPESGTDIIAFVNCCQKIGYVVALCFVGPMADGHLFTGIFIISLILSFSPILPTVLGWLPEKKLVVKRSKMLGNCCFMFNMKIFSPNIRIMSMAAIAGCGGLVFMFVCLLKIQALTLVTCLMLLLIIIVGNYLSFPKIVANVALYQIINNISRPSIDSALNYYYTADSTCSPDGPNFNFRFYISVVGIVSTIMGIFAVWIYQLIFSKMKFRTILIITTIMYVSTSLFDLAMVLHLNQLIQIPDKWFYLFGSALQSFTAVLNVIPIFGISSKVCMGGLESTIYAFLAGMANFSQLISNWTGTLIYEYAGINTTENSCNFDNLWILIIVCYIVLPLICKIPAVFLIPNAKQTDQLLKKEDDNKDKNKEQTEISINNEENV